jgi:PAS domain S-box-containing protein
MKAGSEAPDVPRLILHVEDNASDAELIAALLLQAWPDCQIKQVQSAADFERALIDTRPDIVISDFSLPRFDGLQALAILRARDKSLPFIFVSGTIGEENAIRALREGASDYVLKDRLGRLVSAIQRALSDRRDELSRSATEKELRDLQERFLRLAEQSDEIFWFVSPEPFQILFVSPAFERVWGFPPRTLYTDPYAGLRLVHQEDRARVSASLTACLEGRHGRFDEEYRVVRPDGSVRWVLDSGTPIRDSRGRIFQISRIAKDVTQRKVAEEHIRAQAELLDKASDAIVLCDLQRRIVYWNDGAERMIGWARTEAQGRPKLEIFGAEAIAAIDAARAAAGGGEWQAEFPVRHRDGRPLVLAARGTVIRDGNGKPKSHLIIASDVTARVEMQKQFLRAQRLESIGILAGGIAHDLNNVLAPVLMAVDLIPRYTDEPEVRRLMAVLETSCRHGANLIRQVLAFARGAEGVRSELQVQFVIREVLSLLVETLPRSITVESDLADGLPPIQGDPTQLSQVLMNLCVNARDAMASGGRLVIRALHATVTESQIRGEPRAKPGPHVLILVEDSGMGIPPDILDRIFDPFFTTKGPGKGTGLGLSTALGIVHDHGGFMQVRSEMGRGTTFSVYLPAVTASASRGTDPTAPPTLPGGNGELILVIDDEEPVREVAAGLLQANGYRTVVASDGVEGLAIYARTHRGIAAVVTDLMMPSLQGAQLVAELRTVNPDVRVVAMSGLSAQNSGIIEVAGKLTFLPKPMNATELLAAVQRVLAVPKM